MNKPKQLKARVQKVLVAVISTMMIGGLASTLWSAESKADAPAPKTDSTPASTNAVEPKAKSPDIQKPPTKKQLSGAELYSINCNRCHPERYPTERTAAQWKTIMLHMQIRANLPVKQAKLILKYLQENSGR